MRVRLFPHSFSNAVGKCRTIEKEERANYLLPIKMGGGAQGEQVRSPISKTKKDAHASG